MTIIYQFGNTTQFSFPDCVQSSSNTVQIACLHYDTIRTWTLGFIGETFTRLRTVSAMLVFDEEGDTCGKPDNEF